MITLLLTVRKMTSEMQIISTTISSILIVFLAMGASIPGRIDAAEFKADTPKCDYREYQRLPLSKAQHGFDGALVVMRDKSVLKMDRYNPLDYETSCNARLNLVGQDNRKTKTIKHEQPVARLDTVKLVGGKPDSFSLMVDHSVGWGSYAGPTTEFFDVVGGTIKWIHAKDLKTGKTRRIAVMKSLKSHWELSPHRENKDILELACHPDGKGDFELIYLRYRWSNGGWIRYSRSEKGYLDFEADTDFPKPSFFPPMKKAR